MKSSFILYHFNSYQSTWILKLNPNFLLLLITVYKSPSLPYKDSAFAALLRDGTVVTWGGRHGFGRGGNSLAVQRQLVDVHTLSSTDGAFGALLADGTVVTWGDEDYGGPGMKITEGFFWSFSYGLIMVRNPIEAEMDRCNTLNGTLKCIDAILNQGLEVMGGVGDAVELCFGDGRWWRWLLWVVRFRNEKKSSELIPVNPNLEDGDLHSVLVWTVWWSAFTNGDQHSGTNISYHKLPLAAAMVL